MTRPRTAAKPPAQRRSGRAARRWGAVPGGLGFAVVGVAALTMTSALLPDERPTPVPPGTPATAQPVYRAGLPPSSRVLVCPDLGAAGRVPTSVEVARLGTAGQVTASVVGARPGDPPTSGWAAEPPSSATGAPDDEAPGAGWLPAARPLLTAGETRGTLAVPGAQEPPIAPPSAPSDLSALAGLPADQLSALAAQKAQADQSALAALAALSPTDRAGLARRVAPPDLSALAALSATDLAGVTRLAVSSGRPVVVRGSGVARLTATVTAPGGLAGPARAACGPTAGTAWFAGPATGAGHDPLLFATNLDTRPARLTVRVYTPGQPPASSELAVPAGGTVSRRVTALAPEAAATVVGVEARAGRVLSWLVDRPSEGAAWDLVPVPGVPAPGRQALVGPVVAPPGSGGASARLVVAAPGADTRVRVRMLTTSAGPASPPGLDDVPVPGGEAVTIPVSLPRGEAVALLVDATGPAPVVAGFGLLSGSPNQSGPTEDAATSSRDAEAGRLTWVGGTALLAAGATARDADRPPVPFVDIPPIPAGAAGALLLTAPRGPATVRVDGRTVKVPAGRAATVSLPARYAGGSLAVLAGPLAVTELLGTPVAQATTVPDPRASPESFGDQSSGDRSPRDPPPVTVSSVLPLLEADPTGPALLVDDPTAG